MNIIEIPGNNYLLHESIPAVYRPYEVSGELMTIGVKLSLRERLLLLFRGILYVTQGVGFTGHWNKLHMTLDWKPPTCANCGRLLEEHRKEKNYMCPKNEMLLTPNPN
jgi:hypothetical protein